MRKPFSSQMRCSLSSNCVPLSRLAVSELDGTPGSRPMENSGIFADW